MSSTNFTDYMEAAEKFQQHFVTPMVAAVEIKLTTLLQPVIDTQKALGEKVVGHDKAIANLQGSQKKALVGWGVFATGGAAAMSYAWVWIKKHFHIS
jgi:hypothetical protein